MFKPALVVPCYNHEHAVARTLAALKSLGLPCFVVDDGSNDNCRALLEEIASREGSWLTLKRHAQNAGKGAAVMTGCDAALAAGCTHGVQIDADGQHDPADVPRQLELARARPDAVIAGVPQYDASVPRGRLYGRYVTHVWVWVHTLSLDIRDSMCGLRVYPLTTACALWRSSAIAQRMDFDTDVLVRLHWQGVPVVNLPVRVTYPAGGVSHFDLWRDNVRITRMHTRLFFGMLLRLPRLLLRKLRRTPTQSPA